MRFNPVGTVKVAPELMVKDLIATSEEIMGWFVVAAIVTSDAALGTMPQDQFPAVFQAVLIAPVQVELHAKAKVTLIV